MDKSDPKPSALMNQGAHVCKINCGWAEGWVSRHPRYGHPDARHNLCLEVAPVAEPMRSWLSGVGVLRFRSPPDRPRGIPIRPKEGPSGVNH